MLAILYILSMALAFTANFAGAQVTFWYKYVIAIFWILAFWGVDIVKSRRIKGKEAVLTKMYVFPLVLVAIWSILLWIIETPTPFSMANVTRMLSNSIYLILACTSAISCTKLFGKNVFDYSICAMFLSVVVNLIYSTYLYGFNVFVEYFPQAILSTDFKFGSTLYNYALCLEVQDITLATGFYLLYLIFFYEGNSKRRYLLFMMLMVCIYFGFKRTQFVSVLVSALVILFIKKRRVVLVNISKFIGVSFLIFSFIYVFSIKEEIFQVLVERLGVNITGRQNIYKTLASYYEFSPFYLGKGFTYVDKTMYESIGFASHNTVVRMYAELGFVGFCAWIYWYFYHSTVSLTRRFGERVGMVLLACSIYLFMTYCIGNALNFYCIQFSYYLMICISVYLGDKARYECKIKMWRKMI